MQRHIGAKVVVYPLAELPYVLLGVIPSRDNKVCYLDRYPLLAGYLDALLHRGELPLDILPVVILCYSLQVDICCVDVFAKLSQRFLVYECCCHPDVL